MNRRDFLQGSLTGAGAIFIPASAAAQVKPGESRPPGGGAADPMFGRKWAVSKLTTDLFIVGGGMAGVCAALAAARNGARVVLVQDRSVLGGNASSEIKMHVVGADCSGGKKGARESGIVEELRLEDAARNTGRCYPLWDLLLYEKVKKEPNITLFLDTDCVGCTVEEHAGGRRIVSARAVRAMTEDVFDVTASYYADCSGDSRLALESGAEFTMGREDKLAYLETHARDEADKQTLGSSILITAREHDQPMPFVAPDWVRRFEKKDFANRRVVEYGYGYWWNEWGGQLDTIKDNDAIRHELLRAALGIWDYIKNSGEHPKAANFSLDWIGAIPGKRESRRLFGDHVLTEDDVMSGKIFPDQVAYGGWPLDIHQPSGIDVPNERPNKAVHFKHLYTIPLRSFYSRNVSNLFMAGRNISASHVAFGSTRVMATCAIGGQAVGTAAAYAVAKGRNGAPALTNKNLAEPAHYRVIQQMLLKDDAFLPGMSGKDPADLAHRAKVTASSLAAGAGEPAVVLDGHTRRFKAQWGKWAEEKPHFWQSQDLPAWIQLEWPAEQVVREIHLTFDTGFERVLTTSPSDGYTKIMVRAPQPESVRDYSILLDGKVIATVKDNYLRKRVHKLDTPVKGRELRLQIDGTNGVPEARVFEIRAYA